LGDGGQAVLDHFRVGVGEGLLPVFGATDAVDHKPRLVTCGQYFALIESIGADQLDPRKSGIAQKLEGWQHGPLGEMAQHVGLFPPPR